MEKSQSIATIAKALCDFQSEMPILTLDREVEVNTKGGGRYKFKYATFKNIVETVKPLMKKYRLSFTQIVEPDGAVTTILMHESGEYLQSTLLIRGEQTPQGIGSAITYAKRYSLAAMLGLVADEDDDANIAQGNNFEINEDHRPWLNRGTKEYANAIAKLSEQKISMAEVERHYKVSKAIREELTRESLNS